MIPGWSRDVDTRIRVTIGSDGRKNALRINCLSAAVCQVFMMVNKEIGAWGSVVVKALRY